MMEIPSDFFRDEVRCGFRIPTAIKQAWGAQLTVLHEIDRICEKHGIRYFAEWGTLLGTVRHRGFIPWDDDLDIGMLREDYRRFREVADEELPPGYCIHDYERQEDHWLFLARVVNRERFSFDPAELERWHNYPWLAAIDIFVLDYRYRDPEKEQARDRQVMRLIALADGIAQGRFSGQTVERELADVRSQYRVTEAFPAEIGEAAANRKLGIALYRLAEQQMARVSEEDADRVVQLFPWGLKGAEGVPKEWYAQTVRLPFEMTTIPVPVYYRELLVSRYGPSWTEIHKVWGGHDYPSFEGQRANLQKIADFELPCFRWEPRMGVTPHLQTDAGAGIRPEKKSWLLLPVGLREWQGMEACYKCLSENPDNEILIVPLPVLPKNALGEITATDEEMLAADHFDEYPPELPLAHWYDIDPEALHHDHIVIQDPYDGENPCLTVPPVFYAETLRQCTDELLYIPSFQTDEFGEGDRNDQYNLKHYVTAPGVVWADRVLVQSENIRQQYIRALTAFAGEETRSMWAGKIGVGPFDENK